MSGQLGACGRLINAWARTQRFGVLVVLHINPLVKVRTPWGSLVEGAAVLPRGGGAEDCFDWTLEESLQSHSITKQWHVLLALIICAVRAGLTWQLHKLVRTGEVNPCSWRGERAPRLQARVGAELGLSQFLSCGSGVTRGRKGEVKSWQDTVHLCWTIKAA